MHHAVSACHTRFDWNRTQAGSTARSLRFVRFVRYSARQLAAASESLLFGAIGLDQRIPGNWAAQMASKQVNRNRLSYHKGSAKVAPWKCPSRSAGLDPIVADVIEAHVGTTAALESMAEVY